MQKVEIRNIRQYVTIHDDPVPYFLSRYKPETQRGLKVALRAFFRWLSKREGWADVGPKGFLIRQLQSEDPYEIPELLQEYLDWNPNLRRSTIYNRLWVILEFLRKNHAWLPRDVRLSSFRIHSNVRPVEGSALIVQVGLMSLPNHFFEFLDVIQNARQQLSHALELELIEAKILDIHVRMNSSDGFANLLDEIAKSDIHAFTLSPRHLMRHAGIPGNVELRYPLVLVRDTDVSNRLPRCILLHEFGHAKRDYPAIWEILEHTEFINVIRSSDIQHMLETGSLSNPFGTVGNRDPFREFVADELARKYVDDELQQLEELRMASLREVLENLGTRNFFLTLYARIVSSLNDVSLPGVERDNVSDSIADSIKAGNFQDYVVRVITEMCSNEQSPLNILEERLNDVLVHSRDALRLYHSYFSFGHL